MSWTCDFCDSVWPEDRGGLFYREFGINEDNLLHFCDEKCRNDYARREVRA